MPTEKATKRPLSRSDSGLTTTYFTILPRRQRRIVDDRSWRLCTSKDYTKQSPAYEEARELEAQELVFSGETHGRVLKID